MVAVLVAGVRPLLLHLVPAVIAALVVVTGSLLARQGRRGLPGIAAVVTVVALLGLPSHVLSLFFLQGPLHVGTVLWCLLAFAGLRSGRLGWGWVAAVALFVASALGDFQMVALGMAPALVGGVLAMARTRNGRSGIATATAPVVGFGLAAVVRVLSKALGTFTVARPNPMAPSSRSCPTSAAWPRGVRICWAWEVACSGPGRCPLRSRRSTFWASWRWWEVSGGRPSAWCGG